MPTIFISYRRADTEGQAGRLFESLRRHFGEDRVFMDVTDIHPGRDFHAEIARAIGACDVLLVVIGKDWLQARSSSGERRLDNPDDYVRLEVAAALQRTIPVIPVLVEGAGMPGAGELPEDLRSLAQRQAVELRHTHWDRDAAALIDHLGALDSRRNFRRPILIALAALLLTVAGWAGWRYLAAPPSDRVTVLVADFDGPDPQRSGVTDMVIRKLTEATGRYDNVRVVSLRRAITEADGSAVARAEGRKRRAAVVIWGWYRQTTSTVNLSANFELLDAPQYMPVVGRLTRSSAESGSVADLDWIHNATEMENFGLQTTLSDELAYLTHFTLGMIRYVADDWDGAIEHFTNALSLTADQASKLLRHDVIYYKRGFSHAAKGDLERAIADCSRAIELDPEKPDYWIGRGVSRLRKGDGDAVADFDRAIQLKPDSALAYNNRAAAYRDRGDFRRAIEDYDRAVALSPQDPNFYQHRAQTYRALGDHDRAIADYGVALTLEPDAAVFYPEGALDPARIHYERAASYSAKGDHQRAIDDLTEAVRRKPDFWLAYHDRGLAHRERGEPRRAIQDFNRAIGLQPSDFSAYNNRGNAYGDLGRLDEAIADFSRAIERQAGSAAAYNNRGNAFAAKGDVARALADLDQAIRLDPKYAIAYHNRCLAHLKTGELDRALADCGEAIRLTPEDPLPYNDRGLAYFRKGDFDRAIADYDAALERKPDYNLALENRRKAVQAKSK